MQYHNTFLTWCPINSQTLLNVKNFFCVFGGYAEGFCDFSPYAELIFLVWIRNEVSAKCCIEWITIIRTHWNGCIPGIYTDKKENQIFLIYKEIQSGAVTKSYMRKGFLIHMMTLQLLHSEFPYIWGKFYFLFYQCTHRREVVGGPK